MWHGREARRLDRLSLSGLSVDCIVGVYAHERDTPQPLGVDLALYLDTRPAAREAKLRETVDYARLWGEVRFLLQASRFLLLETAAEAVARYILAPPTADVPHGRIQELTVRLSKPRALAGAGMPTLEIHRIAGEYSYEIEDKPFGHVDVIFVTKACGIYRLRLAPGASIPTHAHRRMDESELILGSGLLLQGRPVVAGTARHWPHGFAHRYDNPTATEQSILCVDRPGFLPEDEIPVDKQASELGEIESVSFFRSA